MSAAARLVQVRGCQRPGCAVQVRVQLGAAVALGVVVLVVVLGVLVVQAVVG